MTTAANTARLEAGRRIFIRILVGVDGGDAALEAARQAALLEDVAGQLTVFSAWQTAPTVVGGTGSEVPWYYDEDRQRGEAEEAVRAAREYVEPYSSPLTKIVRATPVAGLLAEIEREQATMVAVGAGESGRLRGIIEGSVATELIHRAPCSVLVARRAENGFPRRIVAGVDGSVESAAAYAAARYLAERFDASLQTVVAWGGKGADARLAAIITDGAHADSARPPVEALGAAAEDADLLVVGSRGLHGLRALGSVSERAAHAAGCSTLVVRLPVWQLVDRELGR